MQPSIYAAPDQNALGRIIIRYAISDTHLRRLLVSRPFLEPFRRLSFIADSCFLSASAYET